MYTCFEILIKCNKVILYLYKLSSNFEMVCFSIDIDGHHVTVYMSKI